MSTRHPLAALVVACLLAGSADAVTPRFDPAGTSFYDLPFPHEVRRDGDGTVSIAGFPLPTSGLLGQYRAAIEQANGFGIAAGIFFAFDGAIDGATLPASPDASRLPGASVFVIDVDPRSPGRGTRAPLWIGWHAVPDQYRVPHMLTLVPAPGHPLAPGTLYAAVVTDAVHDTTGAPLQTPAAMARLQAGTPSGGFETAAQRFYDGLWHDLETREGIPRARVVTATVFRTGTPADGIVAAAKIVRKRYGGPPTDLVYDPSRSTALYSVVRGRIPSPQFQNGTPPFDASGTGAFVLDQRGDPVVQHADSLEFVVAVPKPAAAAVPRRGWPIALCMHGTGGSRNSFLNDRTAERLALQGIASISFDQPLHGLRPGGSDNFYNPLMPFAFRDNSRQAAVDGLVVGRLARHLRLDAATLGLPTDAGPPGRIRFDNRKLLFFGHSQGATVGPLVLAFLPGVRGGILSAGGGGLYLNIMTVDAPSLGGLTSRQLAETLLGTTLDVFHPVIHLIQMGGEVSDAFAYVDRFKKNRRARPLGLLFTHSMLDPQVTTPLSASMAAAAGYPIVAPTFPNRLFPALPDYDYHDTFALEGLPTLVPPVSGNLPYRRQPQTGGMVFFELDGHFPVFQNAQAIAQWTEFMRSLAYDRAAVIPSR